MLALGLAISLSAIILMIFGLIMPKTTAKGAETIWRIKGFRLYMKTAEKDRQIFYEKENIFEKYLPTRLFSHGESKAWNKFMAKSM